MLKHKNRKGFTLTELLVTIVIIGVLSSVGIVSITKLRKNQEIKFNNSQLQVFKQTAQTYFTDNKEKLPLDFGEERVYLKELIANNYIDKLLDYNKKSYDENNSYVEVIRVFDKYVYTPILVIDGNNGKDEEIGETVKSKIKITMQNNINCTKDNNYSDSCTGEMTENINSYYTNSNVKMQIDLEDDSELFAYNYTIYKNNNSIYTSEYVRANDKNYSDIITINTDRYSDGIYKVEIKSINKKDQILTKTTKPIYIDMTKPTCNISIDGTKGDNGWYKSKDVTLNLSTSDEKGGSGVYTYGMFHSDKETYNKKKTLEQGNTSGIIYYSYVKDRAGNVNKCQSSKFKVDKTKPTCQTAGESKVWTNKDRVLTFKCSDNENGSGCTKSEIKKTISESAKTKTYSNTTAINVYDKAGNITQCKSSINKNDNGNPSSVFNIYVDKEQPTKPEIKGGSNNWKNYAQIIWTTKKSTSLSGIKKYQYCEKVDGKDCEWKDLNKNGSQVSVSGLDIAYYHSNNTDLINKFKGKTKNLSQHYKNYGQDEGRKKSDDNWLRTSQNFYTEGNSRIYFRAVNNAGTAGISSDGQILKIDKESPTPPTITNSSSGNIVCGNIVINASSSDSLSGIKQISYSYDNSNWQTDWNTNNTTSVSGTWSSKRNNTVYIRACDNAGNCSSSVTTTVHIGVNSASSACGPGTTTSETCHEYKVFTPTCPSGWTSGIDYNKCGLNDATGNNCCAREYKCNTTTTYPTCCHD